MGPKEKLKADKKKTTTNNVGQKQQQHKISTKWNRLRGVVSNHDIELKQLIFHPSEIMQRPLNMHRNKRERKKNITEARFFSVFLSQCQRTTSAAMSRKLLALLAAFGMLFYFASQRNNDDLWPVPIRSTARAQKAAEPQLGDSANRFHARQKDDILLRQRCNYKHAREFIQMPMHAWRKWSGALSVIYKRVWRDVYIDDWRMQ